VKEEKEEQHVENVVENTNTVKKQKKSLIIVSKKVERISRQLRKAYIVHKKKGLFMCRTFTRCGCKGIKGSKKKIKNVAKKSMYVTNISNIQKNIPREEDKLLTE